MPMPHPRALASAALLLALAACDGTPPPERAQAAPPPPAAVPAAARLPAVQPLAVAPIVPLSVRGDQFTDPAGRPVRFWGVNLCSFYPTHAQADAVAANLAALNVNLVRPHHILRASKDWNPGMASGALTANQGTTRAFDPQALDRYDYLNAALRKQGVYLQLSIGSSRHYQPGDVDILDTTADDQEAWKAALVEMEKMGWQKNIDLYKALACIDERAARINEEFAGKLLGHVNPFSGQSYAQDPQVITWEVANEHSFEYAIICGNRFPAYWQQRLEARWAEHARAAGIEPGDLYKPGGQAAVAARAAFLRRLDHDYFRRIEACLRKCGTRAPIALSNLWTSDNNTGLSAEVAGYTENHCYADPFVAGKRHDFIREVGRNALAGKPFVIGELNMSEWGKTEELALQTPRRTTMALAVAAYGSLHGWSAPVWFAWLHGDWQNNAAVVGPDGWSLNERRITTAKLNIGEMISDGMMIDHLRTTGLLFRRGMVARSRAPITVPVAEPCVAGDYHALVKPRVEVGEGWQAVHEVRRAYGPGAAPATAAWLAPTSANPLLADTGEIAKDVARQQLTVAVAQAEAFSGLLDGAAPALLRHLALVGDAGMYATVLAVAEDDRPLAQSARLVVSRTGLDARQAESELPAVTLRGLARGGTWWLRLTRPRAGAELLRAFNDGGWVRLEPQADGALRLPVARWHELELHRVEDR